MPLQIIFNNPFLQARKLRHCLASRAQRRLIASGCVPIRYFTRFGVAGGWHIPQVTTPRTERHHAFPPQIRHGLSSVVFSVVNGSCVLSSGMVITYPFPFGLPHKAHGTKGNLSASL
jgi:hypothetical protein